MFVRKQVFGFNLFLLGCLLSFSVYSKAQPTTLRFYTELVAPFYWLDDNDQPQGAALDLARAVMDDSGLEGEIDHLPWARAYHDAVNYPDIILLTALKTKERIPQLQWLGKVHTANAFMVGLKEKQFPSITNLEQIKQYRVGSIRGYGAVNYLKQQGFTEGENLELLIQPEQLWSMLFMERIDFVLSNLTTGVFEIAAAGFDPDKVQNVFKIAPLTVDLEMATGNKTDPIIVETLRNSLLQLKKDGRYEAIMRKWKLIETLD